MSSPRGSAWLGSALSLIALSPILAHLSWRALADALGSPVQETAFGVSLGALLVAGAAARLERWRLPGPPAASQGLLALLALGVGGGLAGLAGALSLLLVALATSAALPAMVRRLAPLQAQLPTPGRLQRALWVAMTLAVTASSVNLATYLGDPEAVDFGLAQGTHLHRHYCATAYLHAAELLRSGAPNVYDLARVPTEGSGPLPASAAHMAPFTLDRFGYPPQFLLLPRALIALVPSFPGQRALISCGNALLYAGLIWGLGVQVGARGGRVLRALGPALWASSALVFQAGNIQLSVLALGVLAMARFDAGRERAGGLLLAGVTLAKIAPGLLGVLLLVRGRWRGAAWTVAWALLISLVSLVALGPEVFVDFLSYHLPRISSGEAYDFLDDGAAVMLENIGPFGVPFKLAALGVDLEPWAWGPRFATAFTLLAFAGAILGGRRVLDRRGQAAVWLLVLTLAGLRSPMSPPYLVNGLALAMVLGAAELRGARAWLKALPLMLPLLLLLPGATESFLVSVLAQLGMLALLLWLLLRAWPSLDEGLAPHALGEDRAPT
ncbi:MAG: DUF2029 domain-containing protein [Alphaproteobacteria bacterium]|nr:DUF2029 domain-containing protein [Alphaproteobacteria bacterium]MCB9792411.1 DUF2029 domain-containing protein [Alphaproteobacteria bacterium]